MSGKPAFLYCDYAGAATITATDSLSGTDPLNILPATEDAVWSPADATGTKDVVIDLFSAFAYDHSVFLGENLNGLQVLTATSIDNFATDTDYGLNSDVVINGDFAAGDVEWTKTPGTGTQILINTVRASFQTTLTAPPTRTGTLSQEGILTAGKYYRVTYEVFSLSLNSSVVVKLGSVSGTTRTSAGTYTELILSDGEDISFDFELTAGTPTKTVNIDNISAFEYAALSTVNNVALISHSATSSDRYIKYTIANPSTSLQIAHICPDTLIEQPWLDKDPIAEDVSPVFNNLVSSGGLFLGNNQIRTMRDINIDFGQVTESEYTGLIKPWVDSRIKVAKPFFFIPDVDDLDEIYFCWLENNQGFRAPLDDGFGNRTVTPVAAKTRID